MVFKKSKTFNEFKGKNIRNKFIVHPPPREPKGKNSSKIISVKSNKPRMVKIGSLIKEKFGPSLNVVIIIVRDIAIIKNSGRGRVFTPVFFGKHSINVNIVKNYFLGNRSLAINGCLLQNIGVICNVFFLDVQESNRNYGENKRGLNHLGI